MYSASWLGGVKDLDPIPASLFDDGMGKWLGSLSQEEIDHMSLLHPHADPKKCPWCNDKSMSEEEMNEFQSGWKKMIGKMWE